MIKTSPIKLTDQEREVKVRLQVEQNTSDINILKRRVEVLTDRIILLENNNNGTQKDRI